MIGTGFAASNPVMRELQQSLRDLPDPIPEQFAREFQASTVHHPVPPEFFERIIIESLKLPPRLWRLAIDRLVEYDDATDLARIQAPTLLLWVIRTRCFHGKSRTDSSPRYRERASRSTRTPATAQTGRDRRRLRRISPHSPRVEPSDAPPSAKEQRSSGESNWSPNARCTASRDRASRRLPPTLTGSSLKSSGDTLPGAPAAPDRRLPP